MNEHRQQAYVNLITSLLSCSSGEEQDILAANQDLLDTDFLETVEAFAEKFSEQKIENTADWLRNLGSQIAQTIDIVPQSPQTQGETVTSLKNNDSQEDFLFQVLQAIPDSDANSQVVYLLLQENLDKLDQDFATFLRSWAVTTLPYMAPELAQVIAKGIVNFSLSIQKFPLGSIASNLEIAIAGYEVAATVFTREAFPYDWVIKHILGNAYCERIRGDKAENLEMAIGYYHAALQVRTREAFPYDWASTQHNLGSAYCERIRGDKTENLEMAIGYYHAVLQVHTREEIGRES